MGNSKVKDGVPTFGVVPVDPGGFKDWMRPTPDSDFSGKVESWVEPDCQQRPAREKRP